MDTSFASMVAVAGTLLGSALTYVFQARQTRQIEERAHIRRLREERLAAYAEFIAAATDFRRSALTHSYRKLENQSSQDFRIARAEADQLQALVLRAIIHLQLLSADEQLVTAARQVQDSVVEIRRAGSEEDRQHHREGSKAALAQFVSIAARQLSAVSLD
jgi:hypothetical protein